MGVPQPMHNNKILECSLFIISYLSWNTMFLREQPGRLPTNSYGRVPKVSEVFGKSETINHKCLWQLTPKLAVTFLGLEHNLCILHCHQQYYQEPTQPRIINWTTKALETEVTPLRSQCWQKWLPPITYILSESSSNTKVSSTICYIWYISSCYQIWIFCCSSLIHSSKPILWDFSTTTS